jgi:hypothetical protein
MRGDLSDGAYLPGMDEEERRYVDGLFNVLTTGMVGPTNTLFRDSVAH